MADDDPSFVPNKVSGRVVTTQAASNPPRLLTKKDCKKILTDVEEAEKAMGWIQWFATKDDAWRNPWVIDARYQQCKRLPAQIDESKYLAARDRLIAYDRGELKMSGEDAIKLRGEVNLVQDRYDGIGMPYRTMPADYMSEAEKEVFRRAGNNLGMAVVPTSIPGVLLTRALGGNETQAGQMGEASAGILGAAGAMYSAKVGGPSLGPTPVQKEQIPARSSTVNAASEPRRQTTPAVTVAKDGTLVIKPPPPKKPPELPTALVGDQSDPRAGLGKGGKKHTSGPLTPANGGTGDFHKDLDILTGGTRPWQPGDSAPPGSLVGPNGIFGRPTNSSGGSSIDIPANGSKPHETLHY